MSSLSVNRSRFFTPKCRFLFSLGRLVFEPLISSRHFLYLALSALPWSSIPSFPGSFSSTGGPADLILFWASSVALCFPIYPSLHVRNSQAVLPHCSHTHSDESRLVTYGQLRVDWMLEHAMDLSSRPGAPTHDRRNTLGECVCYLSTGYKCEEMGGQGLPQEVMEYLGWE